MSYALAPFPQWTNEELRARLHDKVRMFLGHEDRDRLTALDVADYIPDNPLAAVAAMRGEEVGPMVQIAGYLRHADTPDKGEAFRMVIPKLMQWKDVDKLCDQFNRATANAVKRMRQAEKLRSLSAVSVSSNDDAPRPADG